jgi:histidine phosphotransferase ChpT
MNDYQLATLLASKICHDLISPVSAVNNGLELIEDDEDMKGEALELIKNSARIASIKIQLMRIAFGSANAIPESTTVQDLQKIIKDLLGDFKLDIHFDCAIQSFNREQVKLFLNLIMLAAEVLPRGGHILFKQTGNKFNLQADLNGKPCIWNDDKKDVFDGTVVPQEPRLVISYLIKILTNTMGYTLRSEKNDGLTIFIEDI